MNKLKEAINYTKLKRNIPLKTIIAECDCSRTHFNKVVSGERKASPEFQRKLAKSLEIELPQLKEILQRTSPKKEKDISIDNLDNKKVKTFIVTNYRSKLALILITLSMFSGIALYLANKKATPIKAIQTSDKLKSNSLDQMSKIEGDYAKFIKDVTIPDGTTVPQNFSFTKTWRIKNKGNIAWKDRYFTRITMHSPYICSSADMVKIPNTLPNETVDISVDFISQDQNGSCMVEWVMTDINKVRYFPTLIPKYLLVIVSNIDVIGKS